MFIQDLKSAISSFKVGGANLPSVKWKTMRPVAMFGKDFLIKL